MFKWLARLPVSHFGVLGADHTQRSLYSGIGRALLLLENLQDELAAKKVSTTTTTTAQIVLACLLDLKL